MFFCNFDLFRNIISKMGHNSNFGHPISNGYFSSSFFQINFHLSWCLPIRLTKSSPKSGFATERKWDTVANFWRPINGKINILSAVINNCTEPKLYDTEGLARMSHGCGFNRERNYSRTKYLTKMTNWTCLMSIQEQFATYCPLSQHDASPSRQGGSVPSLTGHTENTSHQQASDNIDSNINAYLIKINWNTLFQIPLYIL